MPAGRPSDYKPEFCQEAAELCVNGATDMELAEYFGVTDRTIYRWKVKYPEFSQALKASKDAADERVERSLYHRAVGYTFNSEEIRVLRDGTVVRVPIIEHLPPDTTAAIFWLKNHKPSDWRDKQEHEHSGPGGKPIETIDLTDTERGRRIAFALSKAQRAAEDPTDR